MSLADDEAQLGQIAADLADGLDRHLAPWVDRLLLDRSGGRIEAARRQQVTLEVTASALPAVRALLETDIDRQRTNPLSIIRSALEPATRALAAAGIEPIVRDGFAERSFPDDRYGLVPAGFIDIAEELHEPGLRWGAAKAHVHLARRRAEGRR